MRYSLKNKKPLAMFKRRRYYTRVSKHLVWGNSGVKLLSRVILPRRRLRWIKIWMKWHYKSKQKQFKFKITKRHRYYWFRIKNCMPCTRKSDKSRMGKGKGKLVGWSGNLQAGHFIMELAYTKFSIVKPLFLYLKSKFTGRIQGVIRPTFRTVQTFCGRMGYLPYYQQRRLLTYRRIYFMARRNSWPRHATDVQKIK